MKEEKLEEAKRLYETANADQKYVLESLFPELAGSEDERIRKELLEHCINRRDGKQVCVDASDYRRWADWLEKQGEKKPNPYSGTSFEYNGHTWGMCARDNGVDILLDKQLFKHLEKQDEQKPAWSEEDEKMINDAISFISHSAFKTIGKGKKNTISWLKSLKDRVQPKQEWSEDDDDKFFFLKARLKDYEDCIIYDEELSEWQKNNVRETTKEFLEWLDSIKERIGG